MSNSTLRIALAAAGFAMVAVACTTVPTGPRQIAEVSFNGNYNEISGTLSDGLAFKGVSWFNDGRPRGDFCLTAGEMVCSGRYNATLARRIKGQMVCSNGLTGNYVTERIPRDNYVIAISAEGGLSDGRTATATFSEMRQGSGKTTCFVPTQ